MLTLHFYRRKDVFKFSINLSFSSTRRGGADEPQKQAPELYAGGEEAAPV